MFNLLTVMKILMGILFSRLKKMGGLEEIKLH